MVAVAFRVDASSKIGVGHVMRCLSLADNLKSQGASCHFICRDFPGNASKRIKNSGHGLSLLPLELPDTWLGASLENDGAQSANIALNLQPTWLIVDHYEIEGPWFATQRAAIPGLRILAIDDLANRALDCDYLLDPTHGRNPRDYYGLTPQACTLLLGPDYALLRPEFSALRHSSLERRKSGKPDIPHILISLGGGDTPEVEEYIYSVLVKLRSSTYFTATMIVGNTNVSDFLTRNPVDWFRVQAYSRDMASEISKADIAIGAAGGSSWERCCLGLPSIVLTLADNQRNIAAALANAQAAIVTPQDNAKLESALVNLLQNPSDWLAISENAATICDGNGIHRITKLLES